MGYRNRAQAICEKITPEYITEGNVTHAQIQTMRDCIVFMVGEAESLSRKNINIKRALEEIKARVEEEL